MGVHKNIGVDKFPKQSHWRGKQVSVCFEYDTSNTIDGIIVRDDLEEPFITGIILSDNRMVLATECQYSLKTH